MAQKNKKGMDLASALKSEKRPAVTAGAKENVKEEQGAHIFARISPEAKKQLAILKIETNSQSLQVLIMEAINDLFLKYGKEPIA